MAQLAGVLSMDALAGIGAQTQALAKLEKLEEEIDAALARRKSNGLLRRGLRAWKRGDVVRAGQLALQATDADASNAQAYHVLGMALEKMGHLHKALVTYEHAYSLNPNDPELLINLGLIAWNLKMTEGAARMFRTYIAACPDSPLGYNNLGSALYDMGETEIAIETLRAAIYRMPEESILWNSLATVLAENGRAQESLVFYEEAVRLDPGFSRPHHNLGFAYAHLNRPEEALATYDRSLERAVDETDRIESKHSRSICLIGMGRLEEGFREYEIRNHQRFRAYFHIVTRAPRWQDEPLEGKKLLAVSEQGLGDEIMFANVLPDLARAVGPDGKLQIAVEERLVSLFQRSFPAAEVGAYDDRKLVDKDGPKELRFIPWATGANEPDFFALTGSALQFYRKRVEDFPGKAFLVPDAARVAGYRAELEAFGPGPYIGVCWRSMMMGPKRAKYYSALDMWGPLLRTPGVTFVNLQYGDCAVEVARARDVTGVEIKSIGGLDLKNDIDGAAALSAAVDLVISAPTAAAATAGAVGTETWFITAGPTWPQLGTKHYPWYPKSRVHAPTKFAEWKMLIPQIGEALSEWVAARDR